MSVTATISNTVKRLNKCRYNFDECVPKTKQDVYNFITTWLEPTSDENKLTKYKINNELWTITHSFTREFYFHCVLKNEKTDEYAFHVWNKDYAKLIWDDNNNLFEFNDLMSCYFPNFDRYNSYDEMIEGVVNKYSQMWKIDSN